MNDWLTQNGIWEMNGALATLAIVLILLDALLLPAGRRSLIRRPLGPLALYLGFVALALLVPEGVKSSWIRVAALATVLIAVARGGMILATETRFGQWLLPPIPRILQDVLQGLIFAGIGLLCLHAAGLDPGQLLTTSALLTAVIGLALQDTLGNLFSGLALQLGQHFQVGDWIEVEGSSAPHMGRVVEIGWRATKVVTLNETEIVLPNGVIAKSIFLNYTRPVALQRREIMFSAAYEIPPGRVRAAAVDCLAGVPEVRTDPAPSVVTAAFEDSGIRYELRYFTEDHRGARVTDGLVRDRLWYALKRNGIKIPFPQRDVHLHPVDAQAEAATALESRRAALSHVSMFAGLPEEVRHALAQQSEVRVYGPGEEVVREGDPGAELFVVVSGEVAVFAGQPPREVARLVQGRFFGEMSLLTGEPRAATVRASTECLTVVVGHAAMRQALDRNPGLFERLGKLLAERQLELEAHRNQDGVPALALEERTNVLLRRIRAFFPLLD